MVASDPLPAEDILGVGSEEEMSSQLWIEHVYAENLYAPAAVCTTSARFRSRRSLTKVLTSFLS